MAKTYNTISTFTAGQVLTAAQMNDLGENSNNYRVPPMCSLYRSAALSHTASGSYQAIAYDAERFTQTDSGMWSAGSNPSRITLVTPGVYRVNARITFGAASGTVIAAAFYIDGSVGAFYFSDTGLASAYYASGETIVVSNGSTYVEVYAYQATGGAMTYGVGTTQTEFSATWIGQAS